MSFAFSSVRALDKTLTPPLLLSLYIPTCGFDGIYTDGAAPGFSAPVVFSPLVVHHSLENNHILKGVTRPHADISGVMFLCPSPRYFPLPTGFLVSGEPVKPYLILS